MDIHEPRISSGKIVSPATWRIVVLFAVLAVAATVPAHATENYAGDFLMLGAGARALGMGSAYVAVADDATSVYHNPAGLSGLQWRELNFMHSEQFAGLINYNTVSWGMRLSDELALGTVLLNSGVGDIKYTRLVDPASPIGEDNRPEIASREDATDYTAYFGAARTVNGRFAIGGAVKIIRRAIGPDTAFGYGIDLGVRYDLGNQWTVAGNFRDVTGTTVAWDGKADDRIAPTLDAGLAYHGDVPLFGGQIILAGSMAFFGDTPDMKGLATMNLGGEYRMNDLIALRAGSRAGTGTFGLGIMRLPLISSSSIDYAFLADDGLDSTHRVSMTIRF